MDMRVFISALFKTSGYHTETCRDGSAGLAKAREIAPDLIVLDVMMPGTGGALMYKSLKTDPQLQKIPLLCCRPWGSGLSALSEDAQHQTGGAAARSGRLSGKTARCPAAAGNGNPAHGSRKKGKNGNENPAGR
jgi:CheY-like chemotaxis protein